MNNSFIPSIFKENLLKVFSWFKGALFFLLSLALFLSIFTFDINDNSFLTNSSANNSNALGALGSYTASFLIYSYGVMSYLIVIFLISNSIAAINKKDLKYFFIRLLLLFISIILIPQIFHFWKWGFTFKDQVKTWGEISSILYNLHKTEWLSYLFSSIGVVIFLLIQNMLVFFKLPKINLSSLVDMKKNPEKKIIKKEPLIKNNLNLINQEFKEAPTSQEILKDIKNPIILIYHLL